MTAKDKVLKVNPNASAWQATDFEWRITDCGTGAIDLGRGRTEEAAWQNAAESMPACHLVDIPGHDCQDDPCEYDEPPVASVGAKEKCPRCESSDKEFRGTCYDGYGEWKCDDKWHEVAEPKPTPSEEPLWVQRMAKEVDRQFSLLPKWKQKGLLEIFANQLKPKPDSSSIPDETDPCKMTDAQYEEYIYGPNRAEWPTNQTAAPPDSSSISTEQTFEDWWNKQGRLFMAGDDIHVQRVVMGVCERAWNAAKGQSNGR